jgi:CRISPR/Cas system-associated exonuclease Cas4 (RecB family)
VPAAWLYQGTAFHTAIEQYERSGRTMTEGQVLAVFFAEYDLSVAEKSEQWAHELWLTGGRVKGPDDIVRRRARGAEQVQGYLAWAVLQPWKLWELPDGSPAVEVPFMLDLDGVMVKGYIDQVLEYPDGTPVVNDLKTGSKLPDSTMQLGLYAVALEDLFGVRMDLGSFYMAKNNALTAPYSLGQWSRETLTRAFHNIDQAILAELFVPNVGDACGICPVKKFCSVMGTEENRSLFPPRPLKEAASIGS